MKHELKTWPQYFQRVWDGVKTFEVRKNDRDFQVGDGVTLHEWNPETETYTGRHAITEIRYIMQGGFGLPQDICVFQIGNVAKVESQSREVASGVMTSKVSTKQGDYTSRK